MSGDERREPDLVIQGVEGRIAQVLEPNRAKGLGPEWSPKRAVVQQLAGQMLEHLHDKEGMTFEEIAQVLRDEDNKPLSAERVRALYHKLTQVDDDLRKVRRTR